MLVDMEGYPVQEAAAILDVPVGTIKSRCARGRARLAELLADLGPGPQGGRPEPRRPPMRPIPETRPPGSTGLHDHDPREEVSGHE